jgi:hypothetical protein
VAEFIGPSVFFETLRRRQNRQSDIYLSFAAGFWALIKRMTDLGSSAAEFIGLLYIAGLQGMITPMPALLMKPLYLRGHRSLGSILPISNFVPFSTNHQFF